MSQAKRGIREALKRKAEETEEYSNSLSEIKSEGWILVNTQRLNKDFHFKLHLPRTVFAKLVEPGLSLTDLFYRFVPQTLLQRIIDDIEPGEWVIESSTNERVVPKLKYMIGVLCAQIFIIGQRGVVEGQDPARLCIEASMGNAAAFFHQNFGDSKERRFPGQHIWKKVNAVFHLSGEYYEDISQKFLSIVENVGEAVAGDEKLFHFTGESLSARLVPSKPGTIGLWMYELCAQLKSGKIFLLHCAKSNASRVLGISEPTIDIVGKWIDAISSTRSRNPLLSIDTYYFNQGVRDLFRERNQRFVASCKASNFLNICNVLSEHVHKKGDLAIVWNEANHEIFVNHFSPAEHLGRKFVSSNAYTKEDRRPSRNDPQHIVGFDLFAAGFNFCDKFNKGLDKTEFPHRRGGHGRKGEKGAEHDFILAVILRNIFTAYNEMHEHAPLPSENSQRCTELAMSLYMTTFDLP